ncbi:LPXTG cell wall anchor domain-containing protein [Streptomyces sp. NPDC015661]|uniref:LPXTG cell wall anchor domain-containing protein n=1 Tax=Streptomyces sp. NPDC015661 TaxID=3364961 RepID=UPI003702E8DE
MAGSLSLAPAAFASDGSHTYPLHQPTPIVAADAPHDGDCPTIPADKDGWHFVIPGNTADFTKLTVTFEPGGEQVITTFGPPSDKHAYVASEPGAKLVSAEAEVDGVIKQGWFNLSHTCVATSTGGTTGGSTTGEQTTGGSTTGEQTTGGSTTGEQTTGGSTTGEQTTGGSTTGETTTTGGSTTGETTATGGSSTGETTATGGSTTGETTASGGSTTGGEVKDENGNLAETGSSAPVGILAAAALALAAVGAVLVTRRRKATQN